MKLFVPVILIADVRPDCPGRVQFKVDGNNSGAPVLVTGGAAFHLLFGLTPGEHTITAEFIPDDPQRFGPSSDSDRLKVRKLFR